MVFKDMNKELIFKISLFGEPNVGKTSMVRQYLKERFSVEERTPVSLDIGVKKLHVNNTIIFLQIWILAGKSQFKPLTPIYTRGSSVGIFMFDLTRVNTLETVREWLDLFEKGQSDQKRDVLLIMVGGKADLTEKQEVSWGKSLWYAKKYYFKRYFECSTKKSINIEEIFEYIVNNLDKKDQRIIH